MPSSPTSDFLLLPLIFIYLFIYLFTQMAKNFVGQIITSTSISCRNSPFIVRIFFFFCLRIRGTKESINSAEKSGSLSNNQ